MSKKIMAAFESMGLARVDNYSTYGKIRGYEVSAVDDKASDVFKTVMLGALNSEMKYNINISFYATSEQKEQMRAAIKDAKLSMFIFKMTEFGIMFTCGGMTHGSIAKKLPELTNKVLDIIEVIGGKQSEFCPYCGEPLTEENAIKITVENNFTVTVHADCREKINSVITEENADFEKKPGNYLRGTLGACLGGLIGAVASIILMFVGFIAALPAIVAALLGGLFYEKFGGKPDKIMIVIVSVVSLVFMALAVVVGYVIAAGLVCVQEGIPLNGIEAFILCMSITEFADKFYINLELSILFAVIGIVWEIIYFMRQIKRKKNI